MQRRIAEAGQRPSLTTEDSCPPLSGAPRRVRTGGKRDRKAGTVRRQPRGIEAHHDDMQHDGEVGLGSAGGRITVVRLQGVRSITSNGARGEDSWL